MTSPICRRFVISSPARRAQCHSSTRLVAGRAAEAFERRISRPGSAADRCAGFVVQHDGHHEGGREIALSTQVLLPT